MSDLPKAQNPAHQALREAIILEMIKYRCGSTAKEIVAEAKILFDYATKGE